jgi:hypothetical protein
MGIRVGNLRNYTSSNMAYCKISPKNGGPKVLSAMYCPLGPIFYPIDKANIIADCLENWFRAHDLCDCDHGRQVEAQVKARLANVDEETIAEAAGDTI